MNLETVYNVIGNITLSSILLPIIFCLIRLKALNKTLRALFFYLLLSLSTDLISLLFVSTDESSAEVVFNIYTVLECFIICFIYFIESESKKERKIISFVFSLFLFLAFWQFIISKKLNQSDVIVSTTEAVIILVTAGLYFFKIFNNDHIIKLSNYYFYWVNTSFLLYFCGGFILFMNNEFLETTEPTITGILWGLHQILSIACNILFSIGIWRIKHQ